MKKRSFLYIVLAFFLVILLLIYFAFISEGLNVRNMQKQTSSITGNAIVQSLCATLSNPGYYILDRDVSSGVTCFTVSANDVTIDCAGHTITYSTDGGADTRGVYSWRSNTTVKNCNIIDGAPWSSNSNRIGIYYNNAFNGTIQDNYIESGSRGAIYLNNHDYGTIENNDVTCRNGAGIMLTGSSDFYNITNNTARAHGSLWTGSGIVIYDGSDDNILLDNTATSERSRQAGILISQSSTRNVLINNNATGFNGTGIFLANGANHNILINNTGTANGSAWNAMGIFLWVDSSNNTLIDNTGIGSSRKKGGLYMYRNASNNRIIGNTFISKNDEPAAHLHTECSNNTIRNNTFISETGTGALLIIGVRSMNNTVYYNYFTETTGYYIGNSHSNNDTQYNITVGGKPRGNYYFNISSKNITDSDGDGWGDSGSDYPLNETNWPERWWLSLADWGPATTSPLIPMEEMPEAYLPFFNKIHFFITLIIIGIVYFLMISRKIKLKIS
jgi:hypothetical protein